MRPVACGCWCGDRSEPPALQAHRELIAALVNQQSKRAVLRFTLAEDRLRLCNGVWLHPSRDGDAKVERVRRLVGHIDHVILRSEERRVGKECRSRWVPYQ